ncbi:hypothetical protein CTAYLR_001270 [Chrysophaeum taylorii]|uniref:Uncharacterized protein n=1 Tax=Chrysophaeum taylorii TaxID=2483200 RepID=A0AAD7XI67_9STRA|nr:hypothetical protein CTAYLR_001270 [Chrysophaeum taylorii]
MVIVASGSKQRLGGLAVISVAMVWMLRRVLSSRAARRSLAQSAKSPVLLCSTDADGITLLTMNDPKKYNAWTRTMMEALREKFLWAAGDAATKVVILTGTDPYYCAGVDLSSSLELAYPWVLRDKLYEDNRALFGMFLDFPKPMIAAINGPSIGASVTTATLCDAIVASEKATFSTPFARLGLPPEGCSSQHFPKLLGEATAQRMLGPEGWVPTAAQADEVGLVTKCVPHESLVPEAKALAKSWIDEGDIESKLLLFLMSRPRTHTGETNTEMLRGVNDRESRALADAFLSVPFLSAQARYLGKKGKTGPAMFFRTLVVTRPVWSLML